MGGGGSPRSLFTYPLLDGVDKDRFLGLAEVPKPFILTKSPNLILLTSHPFFFFILQFLPFRSV